MPELPEIASRAKQMNKELVGKTIQTIEISQPKCLNLPIDEFIAALQEAQIEEVTYRGKWIFTRTNRGWFLLNLGMGGEILLVPPSALPEKYRLKIDFTDQTCLAINFWWFGYAHYATHNQLNQHEMTAKLGPNAIDCTAQDLQKILNGQRSRLKSILLDQSKIAGIGNAYIHDILFLAGLHPLRSANSLNEAEIDRLAKAIQQGLLPSLEKGGAFYEMDLHGWRGSFTIEDILIGYKEGQPCPTCGDTIQKIKTGATSSFVCPSCQSL